MHALICRPYFVVDFVISLNLITRIHGQCPDRNMYDVASAEYIVHRTSTTRIVLEGLLPTLPLRPINHSCPKTSEVSKGWGLAGLTVVLIRTEVFRPKELFGAIFNSTSSCQHHKYARFYVCMGLTYLFCSK